MAKAACASGPFDPDPDPVPGWTSSFRDRERDRDRRNGGELLIRFVLLACAILLPISALATDIEIGGRVSPQAALTLYPDNSLFQDVYGLGL